MTIGEFLKNMIFFSGMTQKETADKLNVATPIVSDIIKGKRSINCKYAKALEEVFGIPAIVWLTYQNYEELKEKQ